MNKMSYILTRPLWISFCLVYFSFFILFLFYPLYFVCLSVCCFCSVILVGWSVWYCWQPYANSNQNKFQFCTWFNNVSRLMCNFIKQKQKQLWVITTMIFMMMMMMIFWWCHRHFWQNDFLWSKLDDVKIYRHW